MINFPYPFVNRAVEDAILAKALKTYICAQFARLVNEVDGGKYEQPWLIFSKNYCAIKGLLASIVKERTDILLFPN